MPDEKELTAEEKPAAEDATKAEAEAKAKVEAEANQHKPAPWTNEDAEKAFAITAENLAKSKRARDDAKDLELAAARKIAEAERKAQDTLAAAEKRAKELEGGLDNKARRKFAKEMVDTQTWDKDQYNAYLEQHGLNKPLDPETVEEMLAKRDELLIAKIAETLKGVIPAPVPQKTSQQQRVDDATAKIAKAMDMDEDVAKLMLRKAWEKDPDTFIPETAADAIVEKLAGKPPNKPLDKKDKPPDEKVIDERRKSIFSFMDK